MYTNIPKNLSLPSNMALDTAIEDMNAKYYEKKYFGSDTIEQLGKDTYNKTPDADFTNKKPSFTDKVKNFWNGTGGKIVKGLGLLASAYILFRKGKGGKFAEFLEKHGIKLGKTTAKAGEEAAKKTGIMSALSKHAANAANYIKDIPSKLGNLINKK
jgi:hypothetical protein